MKAELIVGKSGYKTFKKVAADIYKNNPFFRGSEASIEQLLLNSESDFHSHSVVKKFVLRDGNDLPGRFALIHDQRLPDYVQVSFFEAQPGLGDIFSIIKNVIKTNFPAVPKVVAGLNGHLNYGAGILLNPFDEVPLFGLPYNPEYYSSYFSSLRARNMASFRFGMESYHAWAETYLSQRALKGLTVRFMDKKKIKKESAIYTQLNNLAFQNHPYWAGRNNEEDLELFYPFRFLLDNENLIFAEMDGNPVGFFLWYPDFNQLLTSKRDLNVFDLLKFRLNSRIDTFRFTEIGILPAYQGSPVALALIHKSLTALVKAGYKYCEGGFIFEENIASMAFVKRILQRVHGFQPEPYRRFAVFETDLS